MVALGIALGVALGIALGIALGVAAERETKEGSAWTYLMK